MSRDSHLSADSQLGYDEYHIELGLGAERTYPMSIRSVGGALKTTFTLPFAQSALEQHLQALQQALLEHHAGRQHPSPAPLSLVQALGQALFAALFHAEARSLYDVSLRMAIAKGRYLQLRLNMQAPELAVLPWEYLYDPCGHEYTVLARQTPIVRTLDIPQPVEALTVEHKLRLLVMVANPHGLPALAITQEQERIMTAVAGLQQRGLVEVVWVAGQTWRDLQSALRNGPWHIFHFIGHGGFDPALEEGFLMLADAQGNPTPLAAPQLARLLADQRTLRLALLNTCAKTNSTTPSLFASTAATLVRRNIPAVLTMQYAISDHAAIELTQTFYEALADGLSMTAAVSEARIAMSLAAPHSIEWGTPVLYMRGPDSVLFTWPANAGSKRLTTTEPKPSGASSLPSAQPTSAQRLGNEKGKTTESLTGKGLLEMPPGVTQIDNRSGGVYFEGNQSVQIEGDIMGGTVNKTTFQGTVYGPVHSGSGDIHYNYIDSYLDTKAMLTACRKWFDQAARLDDIPDHLSTSWAGRAIYVMRQLTDSLTPQQWWTFITAFTLWVATVWLVTPILQWPLADETSRVRACVLYALATLVIPIFVALTAPVDRQAEMVLNTPQAQWRFWFLKVTGAYTGFALAAGTIAIAMFAYYLGWTLPRGVQWLLTLVPLFFSHLAARRIPGDRLQMYGEVRLHDVDRLVVVVFLLLGPGIAVFIYWGYTAIANPGTGLLLLITLSGLALWEVRRRQRTAFADWALIAVFGLLLPLAFMLFVFYFTTPGPLPSTGNWWALAVVTPYFLGLSLLVATLFIRNPPILTLRGALGLLVMILLLAYLTSLNVWLGRGLVGVIVLFWSWWGRKQLRAYFWVHPSFWWMLAVAIGSAYLWVKTDIPVWLNMTGWVVGSCLLIGWAYNTKEARASTSDKEAVSSV